VKLFVYDHCPYCVKARMIFGLKEIPFELVTLLNDNEEIPIAMIGQKMLPVLEKDDGSFMAESMDIITYVDKIVEFGEPIVTPTKNDPTLMQWLAESRQYTYALAMPRWIAMGLEEFATQGAIDYFKNKKQSSIGPFAANVFITNSLADYAEAHLQKLETLIEGAESFWSSGLCEDDFHVFATLRCLTTVKELKFPKKLNHYMNVMSERSQVDLHWDRALCKEDLS
jgi:glutaredoxin 2